MSPDSSKKFFGYFVLAWVAFGTFVLLKGSVSSSEPMAMNAVGFPSARLGAPRAKTLGGLRPQLSSAVSQRRVAQQIIDSSPLAGLAITAIDANSGCRGFSLKAHNDVKAVLAGMDSETKGKVEEVAKAVALKAEDMAGVTGPMGFFDPAGYATDLPEGKLLFYREAELKHGRICMIASLGILVAENFHPLFGGNIDVPSYVAFQQTPLQSFWPAVVAAIAIPEAFSVGTFKSPIPEAYPVPSPSDDTWWSVRSDRIPGDLGYDPLGMKPKDPKALREMQDKELNNGRLAMIGAAGMIAQELVSGQKIF